MGRRKREFMSDDDSSENSAEDDYEERELHGEEQAERALFEDPYQQRKRRRLNKTGKDDATYGVFGEDDEEQPRYAPKRKAKTPVFQKSAAAAANSATKDASMDESSSESASESDDSDEVEGQKQENVDEDAMDQDEDDEDLPRGGLGNRGGIGSRSGLGMSFAPAKNGPPDTPDESHGEESTPQPRGGIGARRGIGASSAPRRGIPSFAAASQAANPPEKERSPSPMAHAGLGARPSVPSTQSAPAVPQAAPVTNDLPTSFAARPQRAFVRNVDASTPTPAKANISAAERAHFDRISGGVGARLMAKMGWQAGTGLGAQGQGIVTPVESKLRPKGNVGIAFGGFGERTKQAIIEDRRKKGITGSDDEDKPKSKRKGHRAAGQEDEEKAARRSEAWKKKSKPKKTAVEHRTYEEILREAGVEAASAHQAGVGPIIDATGATMREVSSIAALSSWTPSAETMRLPELRHNLRLLVDMTNHDLNGLAREGKLLEEKKRAGILEEGRLSKKIQEEAELIRRLGEIKVVVDEIASVSKETLKTSGATLSSDYEGSAVDQPSLLEALSPFVQRFLGEFSSEYERYRLDEVVVASMAPLFRLELANWHPLEQPQRWTAIITRWRTALKMSSRPQDDGNSALVSIYDEIVPTVRPTVVVATAMTPWETLLWHSWLPKVRSAINNEWITSDASPVITLYEAWYDLIPPFMQDNFLDQLVLPKVERAMADWKPSPGGAWLHDIVFPWLPHVGLRMEECLGHARRNVRRVFRAVDILAGPPQELMVWKPMLEAAAWQDATLKYIVPRLGELLRDDFRVNPRKQDLKPLEAVISWFEKGVIGKSIMNQIVETQVFPKWLEALHIWLSHPKASYGEIAEWYDRWRTLVLPESVLALEATQQGFHRGLQMMEDAIKLGEEGNVSKLPKPTSYMSTPTQPRAAATPSVVPRRTAATDFKSIAEEHAQTHDLLFMPIGRVHVKVRLPMYRVTGRGDGKGGIVVYILDDAVWLVEGGKEDGESRAIALREMVLLASKAS